MSDDNSPEMIEWKKQQDKKAEEARISAKKFDRAALAFKVAATAGLVPLGAGIYAFATTGMSAAFNLAAGTLALGTPGVLALAAGGVLGAAASIGLSLLGGYAVAKLLKWDDGWPALGMAFLTLGVALGTAGYGARAGVAGGGDLAHRLSGAEKKQEIEMRAENERTRPSGFRQLLDIRLSHI